MNYRKRDEKRNLCCSIILFILKKKKKSLTIKSTPKFILNRILSLSILLRHLVKTRHENTNIWTTLSCYLVLEPSNKHCF